MKNSPRSPQLEKARMQQQRRPNAAKKKKKEKKKTISFTAVSRGIKYLGINLTKGVKDLYTDNCKTLMTETEEDTNK